MKALNILDALYNFASFRKVDIDEAIAELEALQTPKSCDGCKWEIYEFRLTNGLDVCNYCTREYIDRYEPKDSK